jgi:Carboxypeptidase regulatory-like domain
VTTYYPGVTDGAAATTIEIVSGQNLAGTNIRLRKSPVFRIKGKLALGTSDERTQRLRVTVLQRDAPFVDFGGTSASIAKDGSFELTGIPPGSYTLAAMATNGMLKILARQPVDIANRNIDTVLLSIQPTNTVQGSIKVEGQAPSSATQTPTDLSTIRVNLVATDGTAFNMPNATVKGDGTFSLSDVPAGNYRVNVVSLPDGAYLKSIRYENQDLLASAVNIAQSGGSLQIGLSTAAGEVNGSVTTDQQQPAAGALVTLVPDPVVPDQTLLNRTSTADQNGQFTLKNLAPGKYRLYAWEDVENGAPYDPEFLKPIENLGTKIIMEENGHQQVSVPRITTAQIEQSKLK